MPEKAGKGKEKQLMDLNALEEKWQKYWAEQGINKFNPDSRKPVYSIDTPPPTVSGTMHMGHAFSYAHTDFIARYKKMAGHELFYPFGFDDNGLATERFVEKKLGIKGSEMPRPEFVKLCLKETTELEADLIRRWKRLGFACDWSINYRTIDDYAVKQSQRSFVELYLMDRVYRKEGVTIWCPECRTAVAQVELKDKELSSEFSDIYFELVEAKGKKKERIVIATTRPELLPACVAIFINPTDERNRQLIGRKAVVPLFGQAVPVMADEKVDPSKGSGIVMCCTFGDLTDADWWKAYNLPLKIAITPEGRMTSIAKGFEGLAIKEARKKILEALKENGFLKESKPIKHMVNVHERCEREIEFLITQQWYIKYLDLKDEFLKLGAKIKWHPHFMKSRYDHWVAGLKWDWGISRQRFFGVPIPVWYCGKCSEPLIASEEELPVDPMVDKPEAGECPKCGSKEFTGEKDVMDTWATSSLTPQIALKWKEDNEFFNKMHPMDLRTQAHDIITFWAFNTIVKSYFHEKEIPWTDIMISGYILDPSRQKMSKSKGNIVEPMQAIQNYSADCLRYWAGTASLGQDIPFDEKELMSGKKFIVKLLNAANFVQNMLEGFDLRRIDETKLKLNPTDKWILSRLNSLIARATEAMESFEFSKALSQARDFFWLEFCDYYLEEIKYRLYNEKKFGLESKQACQHVLRAVLFDLIKLLAPFMPHITEEIYQKMFRNHLALPSIHLSLWPKANEKLISGHYEELGKHFNDVTSAIRQFKQKNKLPLNAELKEIILFVDNDELVGMFEEASEDLREANHVISMDVLIAEAPEKAIQVNQNIKAVISM
jgi:valyl-tRNA synthetase